jgi:hypothetical protein
MTNKLIKKLPEPSTVEEMLIYNFVAGKEVYSVAPLKTKDIYLQVLLECLSEKQTVAAKEVSVTTTKKKVKTEA